MKIGFALIVIHGRFGLPIPRRIPVLGVMGKPITTAEYMRQALTHPLYGYYTNPPASQLEKKLQQQGGTNDDWDDDEWDDEPEESSSSKKSANAGKVFVPWGLLCCSKKEHNNKGIYVRTR